jgi:succinyl-CoA synthetase beta subunit
MRFQDECPESVLIEPWIGFTRELYLGVIVDGAASGYALLYGPNGGMDIESGPPPARYDIGAAHRFRAWQFRGAIEAVEADPVVRERVVALGERLVRLAAARDCTTVEINPLVVLEDGKLLALDAKVVRDDWAHYRQRDLAVALEADKRRQPKLLQDCLDMQHMYVRLDGDVALISGGAGMTMAAMDMIQDLGGRPACFLDCSPGPASTRGYMPAFAMLDADPAVKVILVSVFGGGTHMDRVASAMRDIMPTRTSRKPVVFRLDGTHVDRVDAILADIGATNHASLESAVTEAVALAGQGA